MNFRDWLKTATKKDGSFLSPGSVDHYDGGLKTTSKDMLDAGVIKKRLEDMDMLELDIAISIILKDKAFQIKDGIGKGMYRNSLKRYRCFRYLNSDAGLKELAEEDAVKKDASLTVTEKETIIKARRGQGVYRDKLIKKYDHKCVVTQISTPQVLVASHIKPWAVCDNKERIDENNGLLLSATYDRLFDSGLITFSKNGVLKVSDLISTENAKKLNIKSGQKYNIKYSAQMEEYLKYHNEVIFVG